MREHMEAERITSKGSIPSPPREFTSAFKPEFHIASLPGRRTPCQLQLPSAPSQPHLLPTLVKSHQTQLVFWRVRTRTLGDDSLPEAVSCCSVVPAVHPNGGKRGALNAPICNRETCTVTTFRRQPPELRPSPPPPAPWVSACPRWVSWIRLPQLLGHSINVLRDIPISLGSTPPLSSKKSGH
ncbi:hypothetical protein KIL84_015241 [Mauremys mutica]|uniref:Uncharacterized protein n=1 Tax=Mauremys mutica TaxID=74926 RepID=A0A9D3WQC8_9SAUR|nr:hypothetical protein KIL84_015241 [Mauremys mutica]